MADTLDEGVLLDLITKRRSGKFTASVLLWAIDTLDLAALQRGDLHVVSSNERDQENERKWHRLFGFFKQQYVEVTEKLFPLEPHMREVIEMTFPEGHPLHNATYREILTWADSQGMELAPPRATGEYMEENDPEHRNHYVGGGIIRNSLRNFCVAFFFEEKTGLRWLEHSYPNTGVTWLFVKKWVNQ